MPSIGTEFEVTTSSYLGLIFAVFMVCVMVGSSFFKLLSSTKEDLYRIPLYLHTIAFLAMGSVALFLENKFVVYTSFLVFEVRYLYSFIASNSFYIMITTIVSNSEYRFYYIGIKNKEYLL